MIMVGDIHGQLRSFVYMVEKGHFRGENFIQVGDLGLGFYSKEHDIHNLEILNEIMVERDCTFYAIRGNHDDPWYWESEEFVSFERVKLVKDYTVAEIEGKNILFLGGGISIDRIRRREGHDYWSNEVFDYDDDKLNNCIRNRVIDVVVSHIAPQIAWPREFNEIVNHFIDAEARMLNRDLKGELLIERELMGRVYNHVKPKHWYYGHYHKNVKEKIENTEFICTGIINLYDDSTGEFST